ncbi:MAG: hypothetical protein HYT77_10495, partial [Deltaproteobacteria bacterium]|nr:hypothetical protein [Deltaproteobacteria bacterium]
EICGDALCNGSESPTNCPSDCGSVAGGGGYCGDGSCQAARGETTTTCASDCSSQQQQQQSVNLPSTFTVTRGSITADTCPIFDVGDAGGTATMTISSQTASSFLASIPITNALSSSFGEPGPGVPTAGDATTGTGIKTATTWSVTTTRLYSIACGISYSQTFAGSLSPLGCTTVTETLTITTADPSCNGMVGSNTVGASCSGTYASAGCSP